MNNIFQADQSMEGFKMKSNFKLKVFCLLSVFLISCLSATSHAVTYFGQVVAVSNSDTIKVLSLGRVIKVRLSGIDSPDKSQAYSEEAMSFMESIAIGKRVMVITKDDHVLDATTGEVILPNKQSLNHELIKAGFAWWDIHFLENTTTLHALELKARARKSGLWQDKYAVPPWEFVKMENQRQLSKR